MEIFKMKLLRNKGKVVRIKLVMVARACNPSNWEAKTRGRILS
jgi:hypothetical protein